MTDVHPESQQLHDRPKDQGKELIQVNLIEEGKEAHHIFISADLSSYLKQALLNHLKEFKDVFEWTK